MIQCDLPMFRGITSLKALLRATSEPLRRIQDNTVDDTANFSEVPIDICFLMLFNFLKRNDVRTLRIKPTTGISSVISRRAVFSE